MKRPRQTLSEMVDPNAYVLDIGCGPGSYSNHYPNKTSIDAFAKVNPDILMDVEKEDLPFEENSFDEVFMIDFIEHLDKDRGWQILEQSQKITRGRVWILTPLWWQTNEKHVNDPSCWAYGNKWDLHKSLWTREDFHNFTELGWKNNLGEYFWGYWQKK